MPNWLSQISRLVILHSLFWIGVWFYYLYFFSYNSSNQAYAIWFSLCLMPVTIVTTYVVTNLLIPQYYLNRKYFAFGIYLLYTMILSSYAIILSIFGCFIILTEVEMDKMPPLSRNFWFVSTLVYLVVILVSSVRVMQLGHKRLNQAQAKENDLLQRELLFKEQELSLLKKQIHPHFLFNSLNTIYGLSVRKAAHTPEVILKLSNLLDYLLYQANKPLVSLDKELDHLEAYISMEKVRFHDSLSVDTDFDNINGALSLPPMLLLPLVENAFKHGSMINDVLVVDITCSYNDELLSFTVRNTSLIETSPNSQGIGLSNLLKRLEFLYHKRYSLDRSYDSPHYTVILTISEPQKLYSYDV